MEDKPALKEKNLRLEAAYQKMNPEGRDTLDFLVERLAEVHRVNKEVSLSPGIARKRTKRRD